MLLIYKNNFDSGAEPVMQRRRLYHRLNTATGRGLPGLFAKQLSGPSLLHLGIEAGWPVAQAGGRPCGEICLQARAELWLNSPRSFEVPLHARLSGARDISGDGVNYLLKKWLKTLRRDLLAGAVAGVAGPTFATCMTLLVAPAAMAQNWPARTIRFIAPFPPGGGTDLNARMIAPRLASALGQQVIVENRPGAGGMLGTEIVAKSPPDGYNMVIATIGPIAINPSLYSKMPYDPVKDLAPVTITGEVPNGLVVHPALPVKSIKELIALAKQRPRELNFGSSGNGAGDHLAGEMLNVMAGIRMTHVPYKGGAPAMVDLLAGNIQLIFATLATGIPYIKSGRVRALAMAAPTRFALLPDVPTVAEAGVPGFAVTNWAGIFVAAGAADN
jgi:tripartite-type tricarboxylate transporter receptor subunit TctC